MGRDRAATTRPPRVWHDQLSPLLSDVQTSNLDVAIAGISITKDRERMLDFSYPMFNAGLQVMAARTSGTNRTDELRGFVVAGVGRYLIALIVVLLLAGNLVRLAGEVLTDGIFAHEDYGIAFPTGSALRKKVNTTLLEMRADGSYDRIYEHYFGATTGI